jgi:hypothetical protein
MKACDAGWRHGSGQTVETAGEYGASHPERHNRKIRLDTTKQDKKLQEMLGFAGTGRWTCNFTGLAGVIPRLCRATPLAAHADAPRCALIILRKNNSKRVRVASEIISLGEGGPDFILNHLLALHHRRRRRCQIRLERRVLYNSGETSVR